MKTIIDRVKGRWVYRCVLCQQPARELTGSCCATCWERLR